MRFFPVVSALPLLLAALACSGDPGTTSQPGPAPAQVATGIPSAPATTEPVAPVNVACEATSPRTVPLQLHTLPDEGEAPFVNALAAAKKSIRVMVYMMGFGGILDTLVAKAQDGVSVQVILDGEEKRSTNQKYYDALTAAGASVRWSDPAFTYMHAKYLLVDGEVAVLSTGNYSKSFMLKERNYAVTDRDPEDVRSLVSLFDADYTKQTPSLPCTRMLVAPINAKARLLALIETAKTDIVVHSMQFAERDVQDAILKKKAAGVSVRVLLADAGWITANAEAGRLLAAAGITARQLENPSVHVKAIIVDGKRAYVGSQNLSFTSLAKNREVGVITEEAPVVDKMLSTFEGDWAIGQPL